MSESDTQETSVQTNQQAPGKRPRRRRSRRGRSRSPKQGEGLRAAGATSPGAVVAASPGVSSSTPVSGVSSLVPASRGASSSAAGLAVEPAHVSSDQGGLIPSGQSRGEPPRQDGGNGQSSIRRRRHRRRGSRGRSRPPNEARPDGAQEPQEAITPAPKEATRSSAGSPGKVTGGQAIQQQTAGGRRGKPKPKGRDLADDLDEPAATAPAGSDARVMLINVAENEECRIAILHQNRLEELFIERASAESHVGNIYKGRITNVEPSIQAAFIDFGLPKHGFLHISDLQPQYFPGGARQAEEVGRKTPRRDRPPIQRCLRRGQEVIVQIIKEGIGTKGPTLTTYISIPGRYLVMMPGMNRLGVSRRIEDDEARREMRRLLQELQLPKEMGFILRTAGMDRTKRDLQRDLNYLQRLWKVVADRIKNQPAPCELYQESDLVIRTIRDVYTAEFAKVLVDDEATAKKVRDFLEIFMPRSSAPVELYGGRRPLFHNYGLEAEIERLYSRHVPLPSGGSLVIDSTEALVAIDVNSGRYREQADAEETAYRTNMEAAEEIARQLRLRDLGGLILCDFIDLRLEKHKRTVERALRDALKKHKERAKCLRMSLFGIIEMTRQRMRPSIKRSIYQDCPHCQGSGLVKNPESMTLDLMRLLRLVIHHDQVETVEVHVAPEVAFQLQNRKRAALHALEEETARRIIIRGDSRLGPDQYEFECQDARGSPIRATAPPEDLKALKAAAAPRPKHQGPPSEPAQPENGDLIDTVFE